MASWVFFTFCFIYSVLFLLLNHLSWSSPLRPPKNFRKVSLRKDQDRRSNFFPEDLLSQFLSIRNLTERRQRRTQIPGSNEPPEYMLELYERFTRNPPAGPSTNMVRSFKNEDSSQHRETTGGVWIYPLLFNISMPQHEHVTLAELRFFIQIQQVQGAHQAPHCIVTIYHVQEGVGWSRGRQRDMRSSAKEEVLEIKDLEKLVTQHINTRDNGWVSFDLTHAVTRWRKSCSTVHRLEVHITNLGLKTKNTSGVRLDIDGSSVGKHNAVLIVFSENQSKDHSKDTGTATMMEEQGENLQKNERGFLWGQLNHNSDQKKQAEQQSLVELNSNFIYDTPSRIRRDEKGKSCKRTPLFVDFKDIGWDSWIIQPLGYEAYECKGQCYPPLTSEVTPTTHARVQTLLSLKSPDRVSSACCVPTKLEPISLLYHENEVITFNHKYEGMVVAECGCR